MHQDRNQLLGSEWTGPSTSTSPMAGNMGSATSSFSSLSAVAMNAQSTRNSPRADTVEVEFNARDCCEESEPNPGTERHSDIDGGEPIELDDSVVVDASEDQQGRRVMNDSEVRSDVSVIDSRSHGSMLSLFCCGSDNGDDRNGNALDALRAALSEWRPFAWCDQN